MAPSPRHIGGILPLDPHKPCNGVTPLVVTHRWPRNTATLAEFSRFIRYKAATLCAHSGTLSFLDDGRLRS